MLFTKITKKNYLTIDLTIQQFSNINWNDNLTNSCDHDWSVFRKILTSVEDKNIPTKHKTKLRTTVEGYVIVNLNC